MYEIEKRFTKYLQTVVENARKEYLRRLIRTERHETPHGALPEAADRDRTDPDLMLALRELPLIRQQIIYYSFFAGLTANEIASKLECSPRYVYRQRSAAIQSLQRAMLGGDLDE